MFFTQKQQTWPFLAQPGTSPVFSQGLGLDFPRKYFLLGTAADGSELQLATEAWTYLLVGEGNGYRSAGPPLLALEPDAVYLLLQENNEEIAHKPG